MASLPFTFILNGTFKVPESLEIDKSYFPLSSLAASEKLKVLIGKYNLLIKFIA
jgi:hypothetical protein